MVDMVLRDWPAPKTSPIISFDFSGYELDMKVVGESSKGDKNGHRDALMDHLAKQKGEGVCYTDIDLSQSSAKRVLDKLIKEGVVEEFKKPDEHKQKKFFRLVDKGF